MTSIKNNSRKKQKTTKNFSPQISLETFDREETHIEDECHIEPAFIKNNVAVCIVSSDEYAPFASVVVQSIISNKTPENNYDIVVLTDDMYLRNRWRILSLANNYANVSIRIIDIWEKVNGLKFYTWAHFTKNTYYRLLTPDVFSSYDKVIYLDSDVAVNHDIAELFKTELGDNFIAAALDTHVVAYCTQKPPLEQREYNKKTLKLKKPEVYYQTGVTLYNIKAFRENFQPGYLLQQAASRELRWLDQDLVNLLLQGKILRLPNVWNVMIANIADHIDEYYLPKELRKEYYEARRNPYIIHYVGRSIPCYTTTPDLYDYYWKYARLTPFYEVLIQRMIIDYTDKSIAKMLGVQSSNQVFLQQVQYEELRIQHQKMYASYQKSFMVRVKKKIINLLKKIFPWGTKQRNLVTKFYYAIFNRK